MADTNVQGREITKLFDSWLETANKFWKDIENSRDDNLQWGDLDLNFTPFMDDGDEEKHRNYKAWQTSVNNFSAFLKILSAPENQEVMAKSSSQFAEALSQAAGETVENFLEFQGNLVQSMARASEYTKTYSFDDIDQSAFESFRELYKNEWQKYLHIPKIGLPRELHGQITDLIDRSFIFHSYLAELFYLFSLPFEKTNYTFQQKIKNMLETGEMANDPSDIYNEWIKVLEGNFMQLLQSKEYTELLKNIIQSLAAYKQVKNDVTNVFLKQMQVPTNKDMDEVYKELYQLKKKVRELNRKVEMMERATDAN